MLNHLKTIAAELLNDESGAETIEYSLIIGLIIVATLGVIISVGRKAVTQWTTLSSGLNSTPVMKK